MIEDGKLPSDVGPPLPHKQAEPTGSSGEVVIYRTATLEDRSDVQHSYLSSAWDAGGAAGLLVATALELNDTESDATRSQAQS